MLNGAKLKPERADRAQHPSAAPSQVFQTRDGWILVMCQRPKFWDALCHVLDCKDWLADPRFDNPAQRRSNAKALEFELQKVIERQTSAYWLECLQGKVPVAVVQSFEEALSDNFVADHIQRVKHDQSAQDLRVVKDPIAINGQVQAGCAAPALNGDAEDILRALLQREDDQQSAAE